MDVLEVAGFIGRFGFAALLVAALSTAAGRLLTRPKTLQRLWDWSDAIAWTLVALGLAGCLVGLLGLLGSSASSYLMALGTVLGFAGLFWVVWW